jgi:heme o synthase
VILARACICTSITRALAGSFAVLAGTALAEPCALPLAFAVTLLLSTPPHFWSLAIAFRDDYEAAQVLMLPVVVGEVRATRAVFAGSVMLVVASFASPLNPIRPSKSGLF